MANKTKKRGKQKHPLDGISETKERARGMAKGVAKGAKKLFAAEPDFFRKGKFDLNSNNDNILAFLSKTALFIVGYAAGNAGSNYLDSKLFKAGDKEGIKKFITPIIAAGGGVILASRQNKALKFLGYGLTASGLVKTVNTLAGKDLTNIDLKGLSLGDVFGGKKAMPVYKDPIMLKLPPYTPSLPELPSSDNSSNNDSPEEINGYDELVNGLNEEMGGTDDEMSGDEDLPLL